ncbi:serine hydrolase [Streptoalloteichus hindustanus]|uniref:serine hydrolase n=1 Tax=Streptoalloteichus hindustanus TaxID=2017 RepID=UPI001160F85F|nr:serine hydrolase [Streptoalloteichus hindustanus]
MGDTRLLLAGLVAGALVASLVTITVSGTASATGTLTLAGSNLGASLEPDQPTPAPGGGATSNAPSAAPQADPARPGDTDHPDTKQAPVSADQAVNAARAAAPGTTLGIAVYDRHQGAFTARHGADRRFTSASLVKLMIALEVLHQKQAALGSAQGDQLHQMIARSDDGIANTLWSQYGGAEIVRRVAARVGMASTRPPKDANRWGDTIITANDMVVLYRYVLDKAPAHHRDLLLRALRAAPARAADGFDQHFGIPRAAGAQPWGIKQGWACCLPDRVLHTSGVVGQGDRYIVVVLSSHSPTRNYARARAVTTEATTALAPLLRPAASE